MDRRSRLLFSVSVGLFVFAGIDIGFWLSPLVGEYVFLAQGSGDSMEPTFEEGDIMVVCGFCDDVDDADVVAFKTDYNGEDERVVHRAAFYVEEGENWYPRADPSLTDYESCDESYACPAREDGWITVGDNEPVYDQERDLPAPVDESEIEGRVVFVW